MKLCPQCAFTFEDHLQICDFDGTELSVVPEPVPSFKNRSVPATGLPSLFLRVGRSRVFHGALTFVGVMLSALLIGYYDAESRTSIDTASNAESRNDMMNPVSQASSETADQTKPEQFAKPRFISTQRTIRADEEPSSRAMKLPSTASRTRARFVSATPKREGNSRRYDKGDRELPARKRVTESESESMRRKRDSKVVAILKRTGRILKRPFEF